MDLLTLKFKIESSKEFVNWKNKCSSTQLNNPAEPFFLCFVSLIDEIYQFGYYIPSTDKIKVFVFHPASELISDLPEDDVLKEDGSVILKLDLPCVKNSFEDAIAVAKKFHETKHPSHPITKAFAILNTNNNLKGDYKSNEIIYYNITFSTSTMYISNMHISALDLAVLSDTLVSLHSMVDIQNTKK